MLENSFNLKSPDGPLGPVNCLFLEAIRAAGLIKLKLCDNRGEAICDMFNTTSSFL